MKFKSLTLIGLAALMAGAGCGDNADGESIVLSVDRESIEWETGSPSATRITDWLTYNTWQLANRPYDANTGVDGTVHPVGNVEIIFTVNGANEAFDDPWALDENGERINVVNFIDMEGNIQTSPFITKTDDTGRYILGAHVLVTGCWGDYGVHLEARVMGATVSTEVDVTSDIDDDLLPILCGGQ